MKVLITRDKLDDLAVAVAEKAGLTTPLTIAQMQTAVENLSPGGGTLITKNINANGTYAARDDSADGYSSVTVNVPTPTPTLQTITKTYTPTESAQTETITAGSGYDGIEEVDVTVNAISSTYVGSGITRQTSLNGFEEDGSYWVEGMPGYYPNYVDIEVPTGTAGTPTATKGTVSNHAVTVTPSVTNTAGYISGGTKTGTAVSVSASELVSGSETKTQNGTYDVTNLAELVVNVQSGGSPVKTATGTFTGNGTRTIDVACDFEPDLVYVTSDPGTTASSGTVAFIIARDMMAASRYRNNSTTNSHYAVTPCVNLNTSGSSYSWRATYANSKVTLYSYSNNARALLTNGRTYTYQFVKWTT